LIKVIAASTSALAAPPGSADRLYACLDHRLRECHELMPERHQREPARERDRRALGELI
jgi:hypothetical protein